jgi:hypothetical protein
MALVPSAQYPAQTDTDPAYPQGKARNAGSFQDGTGTPFEKTWINDLWGFLQSLLANASINPTGAPDQVGASQYLDGVTHVANTVQQQRALAAHLTSFALVSLDVTPPTSAALAAVFDPANNRTLLIKGGGGANGVHLVLDDGFGVAQGTCAPTVIDAAMDPVSGVIAAVGAGAFAAWSNNFGASWTTAVTPPTARDSVVWDAVHGLFIAGNAGQANVYTSPTGVTWTSRALSGAGQSRVVVNSAGIGLIGRGSGTTIAFDRSTNGTAWANSGTTLPDIASASNGLVGIAALGSTFFAAARWGSQIRLHSSPDGLVWTQIATIANDGGSGNSVLLSDASTGVLYSYHLGGIASGELHCSVDGGATWFGLAMTRLASTSIKAAGGRLWACDGAVYRATALRLPAA